MDQESEASVRRRIWMKRGAVAGLALVFVAVTAIVAPRVQARGGLGGNTSTKGAYCSGAYADDFAALSAAAREAEQKPQSQSWVYAIRTSAVYECLSYAGDGNVRRVRRKALAHGTGFGYRQQNGETFILTNHHVAEWPPVTDDEHKVDDVPPGCKRVSDALRIVESERDSYDRDDIPLQRVVTDKSMDMAVLKAHALLPILPWKVGRSSDLKERNVVDVRGFPLGAFKATNVGKVVSTYDHDDEKDWDHVDFVVDAQLSPGNSGSPVLAVACPRSDGALIFEVMSPGFPVRSTPALVVEDLTDAAQPESYGEMGRVWIGGKFGLKAYPKGGLDPDAQTLVERVLDGLRGNAGLALELRTAQGQAARDREHYEQMGKLERQLRRASSTQTDLANSLGELVE